MKADRRNTSVVLVLIASMTLGVITLLFLEGRLVPRKQDWRGNTLLMAERGLRFEQVEVACAASWDDLSALGIGDGNDSICLIDADGTPQWEPRGPYVRLVVIGAAATGGLLDEQKATLLGVLGSISQASGREVVPVRLAATMEPLGAAPQARDLREFLKRKGIIADTTE
jgi:hypothetical protein